MSLSAVRLGVSGRVDGETSMVAVPFVASQFKVQGRSITQKGMLDSSLGLTVPEAREGWKGGREE